MSRSRAAKSSRKAPEWTRRAVWLLPLAGLALAGGLWRIRVLSHDFVYSSPMLDRPIVELVGTLMALGLIYAGAVWLCLRLSTRSSTFAVAFTVGVVMRALFFGSNPILEDDYYRYLWDGASVVHGFNPYAIVPEQAASGPDAELAQLAVESGNVLQRVNHPALSTVYPPVAQAAFAVAHAVRPWSLDAWRGVLLAAEFITVALLIGILRAVQRPLHWMLIYWWNPLAVVTTMNAAHMDAIVLPFVLSAVGFVLTNRPVASGVAGALAVGAKLWPVILAPILLRNLNVKPARLLTALIIGGAVFLAVGSPMYATVEGGDRSGFAAYGMRWEMNDALYTVVLAGAQATIQHTGGSPDHAQMLARFLIAALLIAVTAAVSLHRAQTGPALFNRLAIVMGVTFMLLPAQFPWYYLWVLPFLVVAPRASLLALTVMLPLYYLKFYYAALDNADFFHTRIVWIEYAPTLLLAAVEFFQYLAGKIRNA